MLSVDLALTGIAIGAVAALSGLGVLVTYRTTGVFNLASGGMAMIVAYVLWQLVRGWGLPIGAAAPIALVIVGPGLGWLAERAVFRPLRRRNAAPAETLVASVGLLVLLLGIAAVVWGLEDRSDAPSLVPSSAIDLPGGATIDETSLVQLGIAVGVSLALALVTRATRAGLLARAVIDNRELALRAGVPADRVAAIGWMIGGALAGLTGVLLAPVTTLDPYGLTLIVLETLAVVVVARLRSPAGAVLAALAIGVSQAELAQVHLTGDAQVVVSSLAANLFIVALFVGLLLVPRLAETGLETVRPVIRPPRAMPAWTFPLALILLAAPLTFASDDLRAAQAVPALSLVFVSLVLLSGVAGQISLGQAGFAGIGGLFAAMFVSGKVLHWNLPPVVALILGTVVAGFVGLVTGYPALRRTGLALALTTFAVGTVADRFLFEQPTFTTALHVRPVGGGGRLFYLFELACLAVGLAVAEMLTRGPAGRALRAARDSPDGARAAGVDVRSLTLLTFTVSAGLAGLGGALLIQGKGSFDTTLLDPLHSLLWFSVIVVAGSDSVAAAVLAAAAITLIDAAAGPGTSLFVVGVLATLLGRIPGGLAAALPDAIGALVRVPAPGPPRQLSPAGRRLFAAAGSGRR